MRHLYKPEENLTKTVTIDASCHFLNLQESGDYILPEDSHHKCVLCMESAGFISDQEVNDLHEIGCEITDHFDASVYKVAWILNHHFRSGEWDMYPRCGSVVTCVINGRSLYARVLRFIRVEGDECPGYASVRWFSEPTYVNVLCPRVTLDGSEIERELGYSVIRITQIDPSQVAVEKGVDGDDGYYMIRESGYDTRRSC